MKPTVIRLEKDDRARIKKLVALGYGTTLAGVIRLAVLSAFEHRARRGRPLRRKRS